MNLSQWLGKFLMPNLSQLEVQQPSPRNGGVSPNMQVSPREIMRDWPLYKVATQIKEGDNVVIRDVRAPDLEELRMLLRRLLNLSNLESLAFFEVHATKDNVTTIAIESSKPWPKNAATEAHKVVYAPRTPGATPKEETVVAEPPKPKPLPKNIVAVLAEKAKARKAEAQKIEEDEESVPLRIHKREVA